MLKREIQPHRIASALRRARRRAGHLEGICVRVPEIEMEAVTQTAQAARRYLAHFLMSGDDAARKTLVFSPTNAKKTSLSPSDVNPTPTRSSYEAPASHHDGHSRHTSSVATRGPATGADASRITTRFAREAQVAPPETRKRGAEPMDRDESHRDVFPWTGGSADAI